MTTEASVLRVPAHEPGPEQDQAARLNVVRTMRDRAFSDEEIYETLDMLALLPGQEQVRRIASAKLNSLPVEQQCGPRKKQTSRA